MKKNEILREGVFRDEKGRIRSLNKVTPEIQSKIYKGEKFEVEKISVEQISKKTKFIDEEGKTRFSFETQNKYINEKGQEVTEKEFNRSIYLKSIEKSAESTGARKITETTEFIKFSILGEINNRFAAGELTYINGELLTAANYKKLTEGLRKALVINSSNMPIYGLNFFNDNSAEVELIGFENDEE